MKNGTQKIKIYLRRHINLQKLKLPHCICIQGAGKSRFKMELPFQENFREVLTVN